MGKVMKAITLHQPWASLFAAGLKEYETRSWPTKHRGLIAIHAGKKWDKSQTDLWVTLRSRFPEIRDAIPDANVPLGAVVCVCRLVDVFKTDFLVDQEAFNEGMIDDLELAVGNWGEGRYAWQLEVVKVPDYPIPAKGEQGIWNWEVVVDDDS